MNMRRKLIWSVLRCLHYLDFAHLLPWIARLPLRLGWYFAQTRGWLNGQVGRDWRSVALGFRHIWLQSELGYQLLFPQSSLKERRSWRTQRYAAEARDEYDAQLIAKGRFPELICEFNPPDLALVTQAPSSGLLMLTPHYESFFVGVAFLARSHGIVNLMSSAVTHDPRVDLAVQNHFTQKYRGLESYLNGGQVIDMENGLRPFYRMLENNETLVVLADAPALPKGVSTHVNLGAAQRVIAGGALRMAQKTQSQIGAYWCEATGPGRYRMHICTPGSANDPTTIDRMYQFMSQALLENPGGWWAVDLLPHMVIK